MDGSLSKRMDHESSNVEDPFVRPYPGWTRAFVWRVALVFCVLFWLGAGKVILSIFGRSE